MSVTVMYTAQAQPNAPFKLDVKRLHLPYTLHADCPKCGAMWSLDLATDGHLGYPTVGVPFLVPFYCPICDTSWGEKVTLGITLTATP